MNRPGPQAMRGMPNQNFQNRNMPIGASRIQNGRTGGASQWGIGGAVGGGNAAPGGPTQQGRGGPQNAAPLDPSEFPSLSTNQQQQFQTPGQAVWSNQRPAQHAAIQRPQNSQQAPQVGHHGLGQGQHDDFFSPSGNDYRHDNQSGLGQLPSSNNPQPGSVDEFPPLGRMGPGEIGQDRRMAMLQNAATSNSYQAGSNFAPGSSRSPGNMLRQSQDKDGGSRPMQNGNSDSLFTNSGNAQPNQRRYNGEQNGGRFQGDSTDDAEPPNPKSPAQMTELEKFGLPGLLDTIRSENPDVANLAQGHDLTTLGLDLNSSEPLYPAFGGPFASFPTRPLQPDFVLPPCYTVANTHPIEDKITSLGEETLFWIFYTVTRDLLQEQAAAELYSRNWRYHKDMGAWLTKEPSFDPQSLGPEAERGRYVVFNPKLWQKESKDMILYYADLDTHLQNQTGNAVPY